MCLLVGVGQLVLAVDQRKLGAARSIVGLCEPLVVDMTSNVTLDLT